MKYKKQYIKLLITIVISSGFLLDGVSQTTHSMQPEETEWYEPVPPKVDPGEIIFLDPPSDAIVLFDGSDMSQWESVNGGDVPWDIEDEFVTVKKGSGGILTKQSFGSVQLYLEFRAPMNMEHTGQDRGNSGIFLQSRYEVQVLDAWENPTYVNGMGGSIYKQTAPLVNPAKRPGEWQSYNISYTAHQFYDDGELRTSGRITVIIKLRDRKSTRLNSSHVAISYAVFCLK